MNEVFLNPLLLVHVSEFLGLRPVLDAVCKDIKGIRSQFCRYSIRWRDYKGLEWLRHRVKDPRRQLIVKIYSTEKTGGCWSQETLASLSQVSAVCVDVSSTVDFSTLCTLGNMTSARYYGAKRAGERAVMETVITKLHSCNGGNMKSLLISSISGFDPSILRPLTRLESLELGDMRITSIECVGDMKNLSELRICHTHVTDISPLSCIDSLVKLTIVSGGVRDLSPVAHQKKLRSLMISGCPVSTVLPLTNLVALEELHCTGTVCRDFSPLSRLRKLQSLCLSHNSIAGLEFVSELKALRILSLCGTETTDIRPLVQLQYLKSLKLRGNPGLVNVDAIAHLNQLEMLNLLDCGAVSSPQDILEGRKFAIKGAEKGPFGAYIRIYPTR